MIIWEKVKKEYFKDYKSNQFDSKKWLLIISKRLKSNFNALKRNKSLNQFISSSPLSLMLLNEKKKNIKILDYGSGSQELFFQLSMMNIKKTINIDSIETKTLVNFFKKKKFNKSNININFFVKLNFLKKYDYLHISDSLQYVIDWKNFLKKINKKNHKFVILNNIPAGNIKSYITKQRFYGKEIPNTFFSDKEIVKLLFNYELVFSSLYLNKIHGEYRSYPQDNFKKKDRIDYPKTFIFKNKN